MTILSLRPSEIRYSQDSIAYYFGYGRYSGTSIGQTVDELLQNKCQVGDIPTITVSLRNNVWYTADNRRLWVFRTCEELGIIDRVPATEGYINPSKFTTYNSGVSIRIRGNPGGWAWTRRSRKTLDIRDPEPPTPAVVNVPVATTYQIESRYKSLEVELHPKLSDPSDKLPDVGNKCDNSNMPDSQKNQSSDESDSSQDSSSADNEDSPVKARDNPVFIDDDEMDQPYISRTEDISPDEERFQCSQDEDLDTTHIVDMSTLDEFSNFSGRQPATAADVLTDNTSRSVVDYSPSTSNKPGDCVDVEKGNQLKEACVTQGTVSTLLSKCWCRIVLLTVVVVLAVVVVLLPIILSN